MNDVKDNSNNDGLWDTTAEVVSMDFQSFQRRHENTNNVVEKSIIDDVINIVQEFTEKKEMFTAYEVTKKCRYKRRDQKIRHEIVKLIVHTIFEMSQKYEGLLKNYKRALTLVDSERDIQSFVYCHILESPELYEKIKIHDNLDQDKTVDSPMPSSDLLNPTFLLKNSDVIRVSLQKDGRINIPKKFIQKCGFEAGEALTIFRDDLGKMVITKTRRLDDDSFREVILVRNDRTLRISKQIMLSFLGTDLPTVVSVSPVQSELGMEIYIDKITVVSKTT